MRVLHELLETAHRGAYYPAILINVGDFGFTLDVSGTCSNIKEENPNWTSIPGGRILKISHLEEPYRGELTVVLNNNDRLFNAVDLAGESFGIGWGAYTGEGADKYAIYSACPPLRVKSQTLSSSEGFLTCELECFGIMGELDHDNATEKFTATTETVKTLLSAILESTMTCFSHCPSYHVVYDSEDSLIDSVTPGSSFVINVNDTRLVSIAKLLTHTYCVVRPGEESVDASGQRTLHIFKPKTSGTPDYEYSLEDLAHPFWTKADRDSLVVPNHIVVKTPSSVSTAYEGHAKDLPSINAYKTVKQTEYVSGLASDAEASEIAQAILSKVQAQRETAGGSAIMNFGAEVYDYVRIVDSRAGDEITGNIGVINRHWDSNARGRDRFYITFSFGGWKRVERIPDFLTGGESAPLGETKNPTFVEPGTLSTGATNKIMPVPRPGLTGIWAIAITPTGDGPTGANLIIDIEYNGTTIFTDQDRRLKILAGQTTGSVELGSTDVTEYAFGGNWTMSIDQVGSTLAGSNLTVVLVTEVQ